MDALSVVIPIVILIAVVGLPLVSIAAVVMFLRKGGTGAFELDFATIYYHLVALITLFIALGALFALVNSTLNLALETWLPDPAFQPFAPAVPPSVERPLVYPPPQDRYVKEQIASSAALVLLATPVWFYHWTRARRNALAVRGLFVHKIYLYLVVVTALITFLVAGGTLLSKLIGLPLGIVDWSSSYSRNTLYRDSFSALFDMLVAGVVWLYHWKAIGSLPTEPLAGMQEIKS